MAGCDLHVARTGTSGPSPRSHGPVESALSAREHLKMHCTGGFQHVGLGGPLKNTLSDPCPVLCFVFSHLMTPQIYLVTFGKGPDL
ncbi:hypothetical protein F2P81_011241 [Scophthalmus maximus]|uniref:Uncharacterized protein n=1 Tax=Scophthalmus maximus TaxID=52904 RepID=A0A6A4STB0_SCOMX|nr:hypothetical protein F2P81_011241 [Scophthalmus maximus]